MKTSVEIAEAVRSGKASAAAFVEAALAAQSERDAAVNAFVFVDAEGARDAAAAIDARVAAGEDPGPLAGVPIAVKDNELVRGMPTRQGSRVLANAPPEANDSIHIGRLRAAGAIPIGKVAMSEFGLDGVTHTRAHGTTRNPWNLLRTPAGSSGGSAAAVAGGIVPLATASDALGSTRCPGGFTGLLGFKPSQGRIPRQDGFRDTMSYGAICATTTDMARYLDAVAGPHPYDRMCLPAPTFSYEREIERLDLKGLRVAYSADMGFAPVTNEVAAICEEATVALCEAAGLELKTRQFACTNAYIAWNALAARTLRAQFERMGFLPDRIDDISPGPRSFIDRFAAMTQREELEYLDTCKTLEREIALLSEDYDILITPTACCEPYAAEGPLPEVIEGRDASATNAEPYTTIGSICWLPSLSVPAGVSRSGLPIGLLINGPRHRDDIVLRLARIWEQARPWPRTAPGYERP